MECDRGRRDTKVLMVHIPFALRKDFRIEMNRDNIEAVNFNDSTVHPTPEIVKKRLNLERRNGRTVLPCTFIIAISHFFRSSDHGPAISFFVRPSHRNPLTVDGVHQRNV